MDKLSIADYRIKDVDDIKTEYLNLVNQYNEGAEKIVKVNYDQYIEKTRTQLRTDTQKNFLVKFLPSVTTLLNKAVTKSTEAKMRLLYARYPLSKSSKPEERLIGEMQIQNALTDLNNLNNREDVYLLLDNALELDRMDYFSAMLDNLLAKRGKDVLVQGTSIVVSEASSVADMITEQKYYDTINDYRLGLKFTDRKMAELNYISKEMLFVADQVAIMKNVILDCIQSGNFLSKYITGEDIKKGMFPDEMFGNGSLNFILKWYPENGAGLFKGNY